MKKIHILYEDKNILIVDKPSKQLTVGTEKNKTSSLYYEASLYVKKQYPKNKVFMLIVLIEIPLVLLFLPRMKN